MKKFLSLLLVIAMVFALASCAENTTEPTAEPTAEPTEAPYESVHINLAGLKGATTMGMVKLLDDAENGLTANEYEFTMGVSADELTPKFLKGEIDIMAVPTNLGSVLYNKTEGKVTLLAATTLGLIYVCEKGGDTVTDIASLKGKTIYATGKGTTPEFALTYLLAQNGLDIEKDVTMEWKSEPTEVVAALKTQDAGVAMIPQPFVTVAQGQVEGLKVALNLTKEWDGLNDGTSFVTAGLVVRTEFLEEHPEAVAKFLKEYSSSVEYVNNNTAEAGALIEKYDIVKAAVAEKAIPYCSIVCVTGEEMKSRAEGYLKVLFDLKAQSVGGALPAEDFYYTGK